MPKVNEPIVFIGNMGFNRMAVGAFKLVIILFVWSMAAFLTVMYLPDTWPRALQVLVMGGVILSGLLVLFYFWFGIPRYQKIEPPPVEVPYGRYED